MKISRSSFPQALASVALLFVIATCASAQQPAPQPAATHFDVTNYRIEAQLIPDQHTLRAGADVTVTPLEATRSLVFELNGSLHVETIEFNGKPLTGFVQDAVGVGSLGPSVRVDLGRDAVLRVGRQPVPHSRPVRNPHGAEEWIGRPPGVFHV